MTALVTLVYSGDSVDHFGIYLMVMTVLITLVYTVVMVMTVLITLVYIVVMVMTVLITLV